MKPPEARYGPGNVRTAPKTLIPAGGFQRANLAFNRAFSSFDPLRSSYSNPVNGN